MHLSNSLHSVIRLLPFLGVLLLPRPCSAQEFRGVVSHSETGDALEGVEVRIAEDNLSSRTDDEGRFSLTANDRRPRTLSLEKDGYMYEELFDVAPQVNLRVSLRAKKSSAASLRSKALTVGLVKRE